MAEGDGVSTEVVPIPSGPPPLPFLGNLRDLTGRDGGLHEHIPRLVSKYGGLFSLQIPSGLINLPTAKFGGTVVLADPELLGEMFQRPDVFQKRLFKHSAIRQGLGGQGLFTTDDDEPIHDQAARVLLPAFSMKGMQEYFEMIKETTAVLQQQFIEQGAAGAAVDLHPLLSRYTFDIIGKVGFGRDFSSLTGRPCSFLHRFQEFSESSLRLQQGIGGFSGAFKTSKAVAGLVTGELATSKRIVSQIEAEVKAVIADKKSLVAGEGGCPFKGAAPAPAQSALAEIDPAAAGGCPFAKKGIVKDMATRMLTEPDPETGELLPDDNIVNQAATFLIAGHDSTSTAITMLLYHVAQSPDVEERVYNEVMSVVGDGPITWDALGKMKYCTQVVKENLRLFSPAAQFVKTSPPDQTVTLGRYVVPPGTSFVCSTWGLHRNPDVYPDPLKFDPDRWSDENAAKRSPYAWLPFSYGKRGCIGQQLSLIEQRVCLASLVRKFHFRVDLSTKLEVTAPLFLDPQGIFLKCVPRAEPVERPLPSVLPAAATAPSQPADVGEVEALKGKRLVVLFGSNMGSAEDFADRALTTGKGFGMVAEKHSLDKLVTAKVVLPKGEDGLVIVVTSVYNGQPPDNARRFAAWLDTPDAAAAVEGVRFAVFGCGNKQWAATYMQFPRTVSETLESLGGLPMVPMGEGDMDSGEAELSFTRWQVSLVVALLQAHGAPIPDGIKETLYPKPPVYSIFHKVDAKAEEIPVATLEANLQEAKRQALRTFLAGNQAFLAEVSCNRELLAAPDRSTRHIEVALPEGVSYAAGDHLGVVGGNPDEVVFAYMDRLRLARDAVVRIELEEGCSSSTVPLARNVAAYAVLAYHFELQQLASRAQLYALSKLACKPAEAEHLRTLADFGRDDSGEVQGGCPDAFERYVLQSRRTLLEVLQEHPSVKVSAGAVLGMLPPMKPRYYSISSSPKHSPGVATVSVSVVQGTSPTGRRHLGLCSNYLKAQAYQKSFPPSVMPSLPLFTFVKDTGSSFRLPQSDAPVIMVGPGTGVAPMRGFIQDRVADGRRENVLFFGCRDESDFIYKDELQAWEADGSLKLFVAFSRKEGTPKTYVQHLVEQEKALMVELVKKGAHVYVCGDASKMAPDVKATVARLLSEAGHGEDYVDRMAAEGRYCEDVWAAQSF